MSLKKRIFILYLICFSYIFIFNSSVVKANEIEGKYYANCSSNFFYSWFTKDYYEVWIGETSFGCITNEGESKNILNKIGENFIRESDFDGDKIYSVEVKANLSIKKVSSKNMEIKTLDEICDSIYNWDLFDDNISVNIIYKEESNVKLDPGTIILRDKDMFIGEEKIIKGEYGEKMVLSQGYYENGVKVNTINMEENIIKEPKNEVIYRGVKNPINANVEFLSHPTRGGYVTSNFGPRWGETHRGMDIAGNIGDPVYASIDGEVIQCGYYGSYGNKIQLKHEGSIETIYGHLNGFNVAVGDKIKKGDLIGYVGNTGRSTGPHLHFEVRLNGSPVDPQKYLVK